MRSVSSIWKEVLKEKRSRGFSQQYQEQGFSQHLHGLLRQIPSQFPFQRSTGGRSRLSVGKPALRHSFQMVWKGVVVCASPSKSQALLYLAGNPLEVFCSKAVLCLRGSRQRTQYSQYSEFFQDCGQDKLMHWGPEKKCKGKRNTN